MEKTARLAGYILSLTALAGLMILVAFLQDGNLFRRHLVQVSFPAVGTLMEDDPVKARGVEVGRVDRIERGPDGQPLVTLELYKRRPLARDTRFIDYNYSLFGARMVVLVPGSSAEPLDVDRIQQGYFSSGVTESIHKVDELLRTVVEYQGLASRLESGNDSVPALHQLLSAKVYPALDRFGAFASRLERLENQASADLDRVALASRQMKGFSRVMTAGTDSLVSKAQLTVERVALLTAQTTAILVSLEKMIATAQDTSALAGRLLTDRELYERTMVVAHALTDLLRKVEEEGLKDIINFWRNVHLRKRKE
jgi:ABC-type transporter Mla subunit MlaD